MSESPCKTCTRVKDPKNCENKICRDWQIWFLDRWESLREYYKKVKAQFQCKHCDDQGFCRRYSNASVVWKCTEDASCKGYEEVEAG